MKSKNFRLQAADLSDAQQLAAIVSLGMCTALKNGCVTSLYACDVLFRPSLEGTLRKLGADSELCEALEEALEIEDVANLAPDGLEELIDKINNAMIHFLKRTNWPDRQPGHNWTAKRP